MVCETIRKRIGRPLTPKGEQRVVFKTMRKRIGYNTNSHPLQGFVVEEIICD